MDANSAYFPCFGESFFLESHTFYVMRIVRTNGWMRMVWRTIRATGCMLLSFLNIDSEDVKRATEILLLIFFPKSGRTYASCTPFSHTMHNGVEKIHDPIIQIHNGEDKINQTTLSIYIYVRNQRWLYQDFTE